MSLVGGNRTYVILSLLLDPADASNIDNGCGMFEASRNTTVQILCAFLQEGQKRCGGKKDGCNINLG